VKGDEHRLGLDTGHGNKNGNGRGCGVRPNLADVLAAIRSSY
jgi:hypothetical protein